jgi:hypothetical protein
MGSGVRRLIVSPGDYDPVCGMQLLDIYHCEISSSLTARQKDRTMHVKMLSCFGHTL